MRARRHYYDLPRRFDVLEGSQVGLVHKMASGRLLIDLACSRDPYTTEL